MRLTRYRPRSPPPMVVRYKNRGRLIFARPRTGPQSAHISGGRRWLSVPIAYSLGSCAMGQTDGRIALLQNAPPLRGAGIKILTTHRARTGCGAATKRKTTHGTARRHAAAPDRCEHNLTLHIIQLRTYTYSRPTVLHFV